MLTPRQAIVKQVQDRWNALQSRVADFRAAQAQEETARLTAIAKMQAGYNLDDYEVILIYQDQGPEYLAQMRSFYAAQRG